MLIPPLYPCSHNTLIKTLSTTGNIARYLEALHSSHRTKVARKDYTELLLECYYRMPNDDRLKQFLFKNKDSVSYDVDFVASSLRLNNREEIALMLATQFKRYDLEILILIEDLSQYENVTKRIVQIRPLSEALNQAKMFASRLLRHVRVVFSLPF